MTIFPRKQKANYQVETTADDSHTGLPVCLSAAEGNEAMSATCRTQKKTVMVGWLKNTNLQVFSTDVRKNYK